MTTANPHTTRWRQIAASAALFVAALSAGTAAATAANAEPNDGSAFDINRYLACLAEDNRHGFVDHTGCCVEAGGYWYPAVGNKSAFCSPIVLSNNDSSQPPTAPPRATAIQPPGLNARASVQ